MTNHEKTRIDEIVSYTPPQLYTGKEWYIGFMAFDPALGKLHRKRMIVFQKVCKSFLFSSLQIYSFLIK